MNAEQLAVAAVVFMLVGIGLCLLGVFCFWMIRMMGQLQRTAQEVTVTMREIVSDSRSVATQMKDVAERNFGDNSATAKAAKAVSKLSDSLPEIMGGLKIFNETFSKIYQTAFTAPAAPAKEPRNPLAGYDDSAFVPYNEEEAAQFERNAQARKNRLDIPEEQLATMRTDRPLAQPEEKTAGPEPEAASPLI